jgi:hypothetical protein
MRISHLLAVGFYLTGTPALAGDVVYPPTTNPMDSVA